MPAPTEAQAPRVLVVDDEKNQADAYATILRFEGFDVRTAYDGFGALTEAGQFRPDVIVLDLDLKTPGCNGLDVCRRVRGWQELADTRILMVTGWTSPDQQVEGLERGADNYLCKPVDLTVLIAHVKAQLRRVVEAPRDSFTLGDLTLDLTTREVTRSGKVVHLKPMEFKLLAYMFRHQGQLKTRDQIIQAVWDDGGATDDVLNSTIYNLRKSLEADDRPRVLHRGQGGYILREESPA